MEVRKKKCRIYVTPPKFMIYQLVLAKPVIINRISEKYFQDRREDK